MLSYFTRPLISAKGLRHLDNYSFHGQDNSWLAAHGLNAYWNWVVEFVPLWVAPNVLTALGLLSQLVGFVVMGYYNPDFETIVPPWVYFVCTGGLFAYQTLDNIDGKQARRTRSSSPLGELFDHVSDAMGVGTMVVTIGASCRVGPVMTLVVFFSVITPFFLYHWEEYFTGELILGEFDGPTESQMFVIVLHLANGICALYNYDFWGRPLVGGYHASIVLPLGFCGLCLLSSIRLQLRMWPYVLSKTKASVAEAFGVSLPYFTFLVSAIAYCAFSPDLLRRHRWDESRLLFGMLTMSFGYITSRLIVQRVCKEKAPIMYPINLPLFLAAVHAVLHRYADVPHYADPHNVLKVIAALVVVQCLLFFRALNNELTSYLGIHTFRLTHDKQPAKKTPEKRTAASKISPKKASPKSASRKSPAKKKAAAKNVSPRRQREVDRLKHDIDSLPIRLSPDGKESPRRGRGRSRSPASASRATKKSK